MKIQDKFNVDETFKNICAVEICTEEIINCINSLKFNKDKLSLENWRHISFLNSDAKLFAMVFAKRLTQNIHNIIDGEQSGFLRRRHII